MTDPSSLLTERGWGRGSGEREEGRRGFGERSGRYDVEREGEGQRGDGWQRRVEGVGSGWTICMVQKAVHRMSMV